jgi:hypothetical protein
MRLGRTFGRGRLEAACARAVVVRAKTYKSVRNILQSGLDRVAASAEPAQAELRLSSHENVRGAKYYH